MKTADISMKSAVDFQELNQDIFNELGISQELFIQNKSVDNLKQYQKIGMKKIAEMRLNPTENKVALANFDIAVDKLHYFIDPRYAPRYGPHGGPMPLIAQNGHHTRNVGGKSYSYNEDETRRTVTDENGKTTNQHKVSDSKWWNPLSWFSYHWEDDKEQDKQ